MNKYAKQLIYISRQLNFIQTGQQLRSICCDTNIKTAGLFDKIKGWFKPEQAVQSVEKTQQKIKEQTDPKKINQFKQQFKKKLDTIGKISENIEQIRNSMAEEVKDWNKCLQYIKNIFNGDINKGFPKVIQVLSKSEFFKPIGQKLYEMFQKVADATKQYGFKEMTLQKFKQLIEDKNSGLNENLIQPFVQTYNNYMDNFDELYDEYNKAKEQIQKKMENAINNLEDPQGYSNPDENKDSLPYKTKFDKKLSLSKKRTDYLIARQLLQISKILNNI